MQLGQLTTRIPSRRARFARAGAPARAKPPTPTPAPVGIERRDARRGGGPEDMALYSCACGFAFTASVSTSVGCPHCGSDQAW